MAVRTSERLIVIGRQLIDHLNRTAASAAVDQPRGDHVRILRHVARLNGFDMELAGNVDECIIFARPAEHGLHIVNCWMGAAPRDEIGDGGMGFDDQVGWFTDEE